MTTTLANGYNTRALHDIMRAHDVIAHSDANSGAGFDGWVRYAHVAELVDIPKQDIIQLVEECSTGMTSMTHKITGISNTAFSAKRVS